jgi:hypothetical protein
MNLEITFKQVCDLIKKDGKNDPTLISAIDQLLGLAIVCSPAFLGPAAAALLPTLAVKNEIVKLGKGIFETITKKKDGDYVGRQERMQMAYGLLVFTAFFESLDDLMPKPLRDRIRLLETEKILLAKAAVNKAAREPRTSSDTCRGADAPLATIHFSFPHPTESLTQQAERHASLWKQMAQGFGEFIQKLAVWEQADEKEQALMVTWVQAVPEKTASFFEAQYFELSRRFEDFAIWANLQEHKRTTGLIAELSDYVRQHAYLSKAGAKEIDIGFVRLHAAVVRIPKALEISQAADLVESLSKHYRARVNDPIIENKEEPLDRPRLSFPRVCDAFIPQSFRVLRQTGRGWRLEDEATWEDLLRRNDLGAFMLSYLSSPYSTESPLLILGHPGSGKSLLTTVLSSQLMSEHFTAIRVPLREVNAEAGIVTQIEEAIRRITNISVDSWAKLSSAFKNSPPLVILDGYDELLQASGKVFAGYLKEVQHFQKSEAEQGRPVRVIVTSRVTLIDKATVPAGATIVRLLEFDENQRERWIGIWNKTNVNYFREAKTDEFALPGKNESGSEKILALAEQPLLLLMLALYDSQNNQLRRSTGLDRTKLYDSLLRRFVTRERGKEKAFDDSTEAEKRKALDVEMQRLGVASLGMYNRRKVHILAPELNEDLKFFGLERPVAVNSGRPLSQADLLLGSFFFVHKSKAQLAAGAPQTHEETSAFEFLHNTFGEFLTADFILRRALAEVEALQAFQANEALREDLEKRLNSADGFKREWFASLVYTPLFTRPVVLEMMREWIEHLLKDRKLTRRDFLVSLEIIVMNQIKRLLSKREMPSIIRKETAQEGYRAPFGDHPLLGHIAIYSINLILFRLIVCDEPFLFEESQITTHEDGARPWDRLAHIWRSWFSLDNLNGVTAVMLADRKESQITVRAKKRFQVADSQNRLETCLNVAVSLADNISSGLTGLLLFEPGKDNHLEIDDVAKRLGSERIDAEFQVTMKRLFQHESQVDVENLEDFAGIVRSALEMAMRLETHIELEHIVLSLRRALRRLGRGKIRRMRMDRDEMTIFRRTIDPELAAGIAVRNSQAALLLSQTAGEIGDTEWRYRFQREFLQFALLREYPGDLFERNPEAVVAWVQLARDLGGWDFHERFRMKMFPPDLFARVLDPRHLIGLSQRHPEAALAWIELMRELGGGQFFERHGEEFPVHKFVVEHLPELIDHNPEVALAWLQLLRDLGGVRSKELLHPELFERALSPRRLLELAERNPESALTWVQLAKEVGGERFHRRFAAELFGREFLERTHPRFLIELSERNPEAVVSWVHLVRELSGEHFNQKSFQADLFERVFHPRHLLDLAERNPEAALACLRVITELGGDLFIKRHGEELFKRTFDPLVLGRLLHEKPTVFAVALRLARISRSSRAIGIVEECLTDRLHQSRLGAAVIGKLPISALRDIDWIAARSGSSELRVSLRELIQDL